MRAILLSLFAGVALAASETTVVYDGAVSNLTEAVSEPDNLWLTLPDLKRASGFVLKPQGACLDEVCIPIPKARQTEFLRGKGDHELFNLAELARTMKQPAIHDDANSIWLFGSRPESLMKVTNTLEAPDFALPDWKGATRSLSDFRGKRVLLITWASW